MNPLIECLGWTLVHFVWQGVVIALLLAIALRLLRRAPANRRYLAGCVALALMVLAPLVTSQFVAKHADPAPVVESPPIEISPNPGVAALQVAVQPARLVVKAKAIWVQPDLTRRLNTMLPWLVMGWFVGVLALSCRLLAGWLRIRQWQRAASDTLAEPWYEKLAELARRLSISRPVRLVQSALVEVPTVIGWLRPVILLPASCVIGLSPGQLESILAHELAHIHRHDYLVNLLQSAVETLLFYHPAVWWVSRRIREERENCCDDIAVKICGDPVAYARALATLEEMRSAPAQLAMAADGAPLLQRIQRLLGKSGGTASPMAWPLAGTIVVIALMAAAIGLRETRAMASQPPAPETFITTFGVYHYTNAGVATELTIQTNRVFLSASKGTSLTTAGVGENNWIPSRHWFVYIGKDWHVWAYDGTQELWLVAADSMSSKMRSLAYLDEIPPDAILKRLPKDLKKTALDIATLNSQARQQFEESIRRGEAQSKEQRRGQVHPDIRAREVQEARELQDARILFEAGHLDEAEKRFAAIYKKDPTSVAAYHYLQLINGKRDGELSWSRANVSHMSKGRREILAKLEGIHLDSVNYDGWPLTQVVNNLYEQVRLHDPDRVGINFFMDREISALAAAPAAVDPATGLPLPDIESVMIKISPALTNAQLGNVLQAITKNSNIPIKFAVYDYGIGFSLRGHETQPMEMRTFHVDPNTFEKGLESFTGIEFGNLATTSRTNYTYLLQIIIRSFFSAAGVDFPTNTLASGANPVGTNNSRTAGKAIFYNDRSGMLFVRATSGDLSKIQSTLDNLITEHASEPANHKDEQAKKEISQSIEESVHAWETNEARVQENPEYKKARGLFEANKLDEAEKAFVAIYKKSPDSVEAYHYLQLINEKRMADASKRAEAAANESIELVKKYQWYSDTNVAKAVLSAAYTNQPVRVTLETTNGTANPGTTTFTVAAAGASPLSYQWYFNGTNTAAATNPALSVVGSTVQLNLPLPPQINIKVEFVEITEAVSNSDGFTWFLKDSWATFKTNSTPPPKFVSPYRTKDSNSTTHVELTATNSLVSQSTAILNNARSVLAVQAIPRRNDVKILTTPEITTLDNREAQIQALDIVSVIVATNSTLPDGKVSPYPRVELFGFGPIFDVVPKVSDDGLSIKLKMTASVTEFKGYANTNVPTPQLYGQKLEAEATVPDGQTVILAGQGALTTVVMKDKVPVLGDIPLLGRLFQSKSTSTVRKNLLVVVTPTLIHADGTPLHPHAQSSSNQP